MGKRKPDITDITPILDRRELVRQLKRTVQRGREWGQDVVAPIFLVIAKAITFPVVAIGQGLYTAVLRSYDDYKRKRRAKRIARENPRQPFQRPAGRQQREVEAEVTIKFKLTDREG